MPNRKQRTREHIIADLSENHFERFALLANFSTESTSKDYGYDILLSTYDSNGEIENGYVLVQLKATDNINFINGGKQISFSLDKRDLNTWLADFYPVLLVVYDAQKNNGYWLYLQAYFQKLPGFNLATVGKSKTVNIPVSNKINKKSLIRFAKFKSDVQKQLPIIIHTT